MNARQKGHAFERTLCQWLLRWFPNAKTSRSESKNADDELRDFVGTDPWGLQAKALEKCPDYWNLLEQMRSKDTGSTRHCYAVVHKKNRKGTIVVMSQKDFEKILDRGLDQSVRQDILQKSEI